MKKTIVFAVTLALVAVSAVAMAAEPAQQATQAQPARTWPSAALNVTGLQTAGAQTAAQTALLAIPGVQNVQIDATTNQAWIWYDQAATNPSAIAEAFNAAQTQMKASLPQPQATQAN